MVPMQVSWVLLAYFVTRGIFLQYDVHNVPYLDLHSRKVFDLLDLVTMVGMCIRCHSYVCISMDCYLSFVLYNLVAQSRTPY